MADIRIPAAGSSLVPQSRAPVRSEAVRAAQRAFFEAALNGATSEAAPVQTRATSGLGQAPVGAAPGRVLRPGSLVDIKV